MRNKMPVVKCGKTSMNANEWLLPLADGTDQKANHWRDLDWTHAAQDAQAFQPFDNIYGQIIADLELMRRLGSGSYGVAYSCRLPAVFGPQPFVIKISKRLVEAGLVLANMNTRRILVRPLYTAAQCQVHARAVRDLKEEFTNYERIMDPLSPHLQGASLTMGITRAEHNDMLQREAAMQQHPGHAHIHRIFHMDLQIPAILSERCDGTLDGLRAAASNLFEARFDNATQQWQFADLWKQVGREICDAVDYIRTRGLVHLDVKMQNILYIGNGNNTYGFKLGDYGLLEDDAVTTRPIRTTSYFEPTDWGNSLGSPHYAPMTLCCYTVAALLVCCLKLRDTDFPVAMDIGTYDMHVNIDAEIQDFRNNDALGEEFFPPPGLIPLDFAQDMGDAWANLVLILQHDYLHGRDVDLYGILQAVRASL